MADFAAIYSPASASGGISDNQQIANLAPTTASSTLTIGYRYKVAISVVPGTTGSATIGACVRFSVGAAVAASTDFCIPLNNVLTFDMSDQFNSLSFYNPNPTTPTLTINVMRLTT